MNKNNKKGVAIGAGVALAAASIAAAYFLYGGKDAKKRRKQLRGWMLKAKGEVLEKMEQAKEMNEQLYATLVEEVSKRYGKLKHVDAKELQAFASEMKGYWKDIKKSLAPKSVPKRKSKTKK